MTVSVLVPWRPGCEYRERAFQFMRNRIARAHPSWELVVGECAPGPFNRSAAILDAAGKASPGADVYVVHDADVFLEGDLAESVEAARSSGWAVPHKMLHRLADDASAAVLAGVDWRGLPVAQKPYRGNEAGTLIVLTRDVLDLVSPDRRFVGWGQEDDAWALALRCLIGEPTRGSDDLVHLWHPPQERLNRRIGNQAGKALLSRYRRAASNPDAMRALIEEAA